MHNSSGEKSNISTQYNALHGQSEHGIPSPPDTTIPHESSIPTSMSHKQVIDDGGLGEGSHLLWLVAAILGCANAADAVETVCVGYIMSEMGDSLSATDKGLLSAIVFVGMLLGSASNGFLSDRFGRKRMLLVALAINFFAGVLSVLSWSSKVLIASRLIAGIGIGGSVPVIFALCADLFHSDVRGKCISIVSACFMFGAIFAAFFAWMLLGDNIYGNRIIEGVSWRAYAAVCLIPVLIALVSTYQFVPEPTKRSAFQSPTDIGIENQTTPSIIGMYRSLALLLSDSLYSDSILKLIVIWFAIAFGSYGILIWASTLFYGIGIRNPYASAFLFILGELPGNALCILLVDRVERKRLIAGGLLVSALSAFGFGAGVRFPVLVVLAGVVFSAMSSLVWNVVQLVTVECFPPHIRGLAMGFIACFGRLGAISAQIVNASLEQNVPLLLFVTSSCSILGCIASIRLKPPTIAIGSESLSHSDPDCEFISSSNTLSISSIGDDEMDIELSARVGSREA